MSLSDLLIAFRLLRAMASLGSPLIVALRAPVLTIMLLSGVVLGVLSVREGGLRPGLQKLLTNPDASDSLQRELHGVARRDQVIDGLLKAVLVKAPTAARVRLGIIHNGEVGLSGIGLLRFDITHASARSGFSVGMFVSNAPLSDWNPVLGKFLADQCFWTALDDLSAAARARMIEMGANEALACPVLDIQGRLLGGVFVSWPVGAVVPQGNDLAALTEFTLSIAAQIAAAAIAGGNGG